MVVGLYLCATLLLGLGLCFAARLSPFRSVPPPASPLKTPPTMRLAGITLFLDAVPVALHLTQKAYLPDTAFFDYIFPFTDLLVTAMFILAGISLLTAKYPSPKAYWSIFLSGLVVYVAFVVSGSFVVFSVLTFIWIVVLFAAIVRGVKKFNKMLFFHYSNVESHRTTWFVYILVWAFAVYPIYKIASLPVGYSEWFYILYSVITIVLYTILSCKVYLQTFVADKTIPNLQAFESDESVKFESDAPVCHTASDYFTPDQQRKMTQELTLLMEKEKVYHNPQLCVDDLVQRMGTNSSYFYYFMRDVIGASFFDYVNGYRINEAKQLLSDGGKVEQVSEAVGYNSANTFRRAFKKVTGHTPTEWRDVQN